MQVLQYNNSILPTLNRCFVKTIHFIGIGGIGMCGVAKILLYQGYHVTGSDIVETNITRYLEKLGVRIFFGHSYDNPNNADLVVISSAIDLNNPEIQSAKCAKIPIIHRAEVLCELMRYKYGIVIAGTHGKTTTTAMLTNIYMEAGLDPTFVNGGLIKSDRIQARLGSSCYFIAEADESDRSFLQLCPTVGVITNIDNDHMHAYQKKFLYLKKAFVKFINNLPIYGYAVVCLDDPTIRSIVFGKVHNKKIITYGFSKDAHLCILCYRQYMGMSKFTILIRNQKKLHVILNMPGYHNALNATASIAVSIEEGIHDVSILKAMLNFSGVNRRFENLGYYSLKYINGKVGKVMFVDDYGHHPSELDATIMAARIGWPEKRLVMIFQPHRFTRTYELYDTFIQVLSTVDILLILNVYSAGERPIVGVSGQALCDSICKYGKINPIFVPNKFFLLKVLLQILQDNDLILMQGAGTIGEIVRSLFYIK